MPTNTSTETHDSSMNSTMSRLFLTSELLEIIAAAVLAATIALPGGPPLYLGVATGLAVFVAAVGIHYRARAIRRTLVRKRRRNEAQLIEHAKVGSHAVTEQYLATLKTVGAEEDVLLALKRRVGQPAMVQPEFVKWLTAEMGPARAQEKLDLVLKYTYVGPHVPEAAS